MAARKSMDIVAKTGEYQDQQTGMTKGRYENIGSLMTGDDGRQFIIMERWFNPAGLPNPQQRSSVILSLFEPNNGQHQHAPQQQQQMPPQQSQYQPQRGGFRGQQ